MPPELARWSDLESSSPELAAMGRSLLFRTGAGEALLTTIAGEGLPRTHPVNVGIVDGRLLLFVQAKSPKARELASDGRYALHAHQDPIVPHEFLLRGRAMTVADTDLRSRAIENWPFTPDGSYPLFELGIEHALLGSRASADDWPPRYASWRPGALSG